jgi:hypothetical protein
VRFACGVAVLLVVGAARAQTGLPPLPPPAAEPAHVPPPPAAEPAHVPPPPAPEPAHVAPPPPSPEPPFAPPPRRYAYAPPSQGPAGLSTAERKHAPEYSLWLGGGLGLLVYSGALFINDPLPPPGNSGVETTGNFIRPGVALQADIGARLARRYIPYLTLELGLAGAGHRFAGTQTSASTSFVGIGFRYLAGDVDAVSFASDISFGFRQFQVSNSTGTWSATAFEIFRLGFGADVRLSTSLTLSPMVMLSGGSLSDTSGYVEYGPNQSDGQTHPPFTGSGSIPGAFQQTYFAIVLGCGVHVDLFGK